MNQKQEITPGRVLTCLSRDMKTLERLREKMPIPPESEAMQWLYDNLYLIAGQAGVARNDLKALGKREVLPNIGGLLAGLTQGFVTMSEVTPESIKALIDSVCDGAELSYAEFCVLPALLRAALVSVCRQAGEGRLPGDCMGKAVRGIISLGSIDMEAREEALSAVHKILMSDPAGVYPKMALQSRQYLRQLCYRIAESSSISEADVARQAIEAAKAETDPRKPGVSAYLISHTAICRPALRAGRSLVALPVLLAFVFSVALGVFGRSPLLSVLSLLPLWEAMRLLIWPVVTRFVPPVSLLQMEEPAQGSQALVAVASLVPPPERAQAAAHHLRRLYYKNKGENALFLMLCDFGQSDAPTTPSDSARAVALAREIDKLNKKHGSHFALIIRKRSLNPREGSFAGRGRKMGAVGDMFEFISGGECDFYKFVGDEQRLRRSTHCLVLDSDTGPTLGSLREMMATAAHPVNHPVDLENCGRATAGYGVLVPRISADLGSAKATLFSKVIEGSGGVTAYDTAVSDPYQDTFAVSLFAGKGLIDIAAYRRFLKGKLPEDRMLSHDIIEGEYLRCGLVSQVEFTDATPPTAFSYLKRLSRWVRGDWQNSVFLFSRFNWGGRVYHNPIGIIGKLKIADNLRRHLTPLATLLCGVVSALLRAPEAGLYALVFWLSVLTPFVRELVSTYFKDGYFALSRRYFSGALTLFSDMAGRLMFALCLLPTQALIILDATARAIYRSAVSGRRMLEWQTAAQVDSLSAPLSSSLRVGLPSVLLGMVLCAFGGAGVPVGVAFCFGLPFAMVSSRSLSERRPAAAGEMRQQYAAWAADIWQFFEDYTTADNHYLPPDNVQFFPVYRQARRTSPTNIGFYLCSALSAADLGLIDAGGLYERVERTIATVERLEKYHGNLYNWYDTQTLALLDPPFVSSVDSGNFICCLLALRTGLLEYAGGATGMRKLVGRVDDIIKATDMSVFYDKNRKLFTIGIDDKGERTPSCYDFFMSESRLTSYWAVAGGLVEKKHWGRLSRAMSRSGYHAGPLSWTGTMFEYFMPALLLPGFEGSLTDEALRFCLHCQIERGRETGAPWGMSESGFYAFDKALNYQYKAHGVQKNGVKQGLDKDVVVAPYSSFLAAPFAPGTALRNLERLKRDGVYGRYGFYEAADYQIPSRPDIVHSYMSHHMGMSLTAINNLLNESVLQRRFVANPEMEAGCELLQEKVSKKAVVIGQMRTETPGRRDRIPKERGESSAPSPFAATGQLLTNGMMAEIISDCGAGYLWAGGVELTRRSDDPVRPQGVFTAVHCEGQTFSPTAAPFYSRGVESRCEFGADSVLFRAEQNGIRVEQTDSLHPKYPGLVRQMVISNITGKTKTVDLLCYFEPVLAGHKSYTAHPVFSKLGVAARLNKAENTVVFSRRSSDRGAALAAGFADMQGETEFLMDRQALLPSPGGLGGLLNFAGIKFTGQTSQDCCFAARRRITLTGGGKQKLFFLMAAGGSEEEAAGVISSMRFGAAALGQMRTAARYGPQSAEGRIAGMLLGQMRFGRQAGSAQQRAAADNTLSQNHLWGLGISGDTPIVILEAGGEDVERISLYMRIQRAFDPCGCTFDLVVLCSGDEQIEAIKKGLDTLFHGKIGEAVRILNTQHVSREALGLLLAAACHISRTDSVGGGRPTGEMPMPVLPIEASPLPAEMLKMQGGGVYNGAFYVQRQSPLPYSHILCGPAFGTLLSDTALGYSFFINSRENKLTPWLCDPSAHNDGERVVLRVGGRLYDLALGARAVFSADKALYLGEAGAFTSEVAVGVLGKTPAKTIEVALTNNSDREVEVMCAYYTEPVLGVDKTHQRLLRPFWEEERGLTVDNPYSVSFPAGMNLRASLPGSFPITRRSDFFTGSWEEHSCMPDTDPCAAVVVPIKLPPRRRESVTFVLSAAYSSQAALEVGDLAVRQAADAPLYADVESKPRLRIKTPDEYLDSYINSFAPNQIISGRLRGRCGYYQCGGAFGFRDQLQDTLGIMLTHPELARTQILRAAASQFEQGDVLHWWHQMPHSAGGKKGVRTRCSDDMLWLPYLTAAYVKCTGDSDILNTPVRYLAAEQLAPYQQDIYIQPTVSDNRASLYEHCLRALDKGYNLGEHGLPLMGAGDWNDGFSEVGAGGRGESVWLALFMAMALDDFVPLMRLRGDMKAADEYAARSSALKQSVDTHAWDGEHYLRAFFDDGSPMGGSSCDSCRIDLLPQSFAVLADMPCTGRVERAMQSAYDSLVDSALGIVRLFTPPFTRHSTPNPGYVASYPPGVRENGGQYNHSAVWFALALLRQGRCEEAVRILSWINPLSRCAAEPYASRYLTEPYYMAADIYSNPHTPGRGGWTIYTGAAGWFYRVVTTELLGMRREGGRLLISPNMPYDWPGFEAEIEIEGGNILITVQRGEKSELVVDGDERAFVPLDGKDHEVRLTLAR